MKDDKIDGLLAGWSKAKVPEPERREEILRNVLDENRLGATAAGRTKRISMLALISGGAVAVILLVFTVLPNRPAPTALETVERPTNPAVQSPRDPAEIRFSLLILERSGETAVEVLEDTVLTATDQSLYERPIGGHKLFFWFLALEPSVFSLDVGIDNAVEAGIMAVPDKTRAVHLTARGRQFDVFVSIL